MAYLNQRPISQGEVTFFPVTLDHFDGARINREMSLDDVIWQTAD